MPNEFLVGVAGGIKDSPLLLVYNRESKQVSREIKSPSESININQVSLMPGFGTDRPYVIYRDSRGVCLIDILNNYE